MCTQDDVDKWALRAVLAAAGVGALVGLLVFITLISIVASAKGGAL